MRWCAKLTNTKPTLRATSSTTEKPRIVSHCLTVKGDIIFWVKQITSEIEVNKTAYAAYHCLHRYICIYIACYGHLAIWHCGLLSKKGDESQLVDTP